MVLWQPGMIITSSRINPEGPFSYTPQLTATATNPALGFGGDYALEGRWWRWGHMVHAYIRLRFGSSGASAGSGFYRISLPVPASSDYTFNAGIGLGVQCGSATLRRQSPFDAVIGSVQLTSANTIQINIPGSVGGVRENAPWTWGPSDAISVTVDYITDQL